MKIGTFAKRELGITLTPGQSAAVQEFESGSFQQAVWRAGRRSGKSLLADILALFDAVARDQLRSKLRPGEPRVAAIISPRLDQSQEHIRNIGSMVEASPRLKTLLATQTADELTFKNNSTIRAFPCSARGIRGGAWSSVILDELGHFISGEDGNAAGDRILEAALPSLAQFGSNGWLFAISTPLWKQGAFFKLVQRAESGRYPYIHSLHADTATMNPNISKQWLEERRLEDPELYAREFAAEFIDGASSYFSSEEVLACIRKGNKVLPPALGVSYAAALDPAFSHDSFAMAVCHREAQTGVVVVDGVWAWTKAGFEETLDSVAGIAREYRCTALRTDQNAAEPIRAGLARRHLQTVYIPWDNSNKADAYGRLKVMVNTSTIELPPDDRLTSEFFSMEARPTASGQSRIAASGSAHDDMISAVAAAVAQLGNTISPESMANFRSLMADLGSPETGGGTRFADVVGIHGFPSLLPRL